jgi:hypothetical protein
MLAMWRSICLFVLAILSAVVVTPASAHTPVPAVDSAMRLADTPSRDSHPPAGLQQADASHAESEAPLSALSTLLLLGLAAIVASRVKRRRVVAAVLVLALALFAFEAGMHSVHHLGQTRHADECVFASASAHLTALATDAVCLDVPASATVFTQAESQSAPVDRPIVGHHQRAPPLTAS